MPKERKYYQRRNLGSMRIDLPLKKKRQFLKKIITFKESYHKVSADFKKETGKHLPRSTLKKWKNTGQAIIDAADAGSSRRHNYKQSVEKKQYEEEVLRRIKSSKVDVEGSRGTQIICEEVQAEDRFQAMPEIRNLEFSWSYIQRIISKYNFLITRVKLSIRN